MIKIKEDPSGKINLTSSVKEEEQEESKYPIIIKSTPIRHSLFVIRKE
ncbi:MAG: hypothetical protein ABJB76_00135 [Candidatus Nitrosocosmicus sp.]